MSDYRDRLTFTMEDIALDPKAIFIGYNTVCGSRIYGTLGRVPPKQCIETPVAENLAVGLAMGLSLEGYMPIVCFERMDFMLAAADSIINHLCALPKLSGGQYNFHVILRAIVGHDSPLDPGIQHKRDYTDMFKPYIHTSLCHSTNDISQAYAIALVAKVPHLIVEYKEKY